MFSIGDNGVIGEHCEALTEYARVDTRHAAFDFAVAFGSVGEFADNQGRPLAGNDFTGAGDTSDVSHTLLSIAGSLYLLYIV